VGGEDGGPAEPAPSGSGLVAADRGATDWQPALMETQKPRRSVRASQSMRRIIRAARAQATYGAKRLAG
jgi:hypothetical protein